MNNEQLLATINEDANRKLQAFYEAPYTGDLPSNIMDIFATSVMLVPPAYTKYNIKYIPKLIAKQLKDCTVMDVGLILNQIVLCPFKDLYEDLDAAVANQSRINDAMSEYNKAVKEMETRVQKEKESKASMLAQTGRYPQLLKR